MQLPNQIDISSIAGANNTAHYEHLAAMQQQNKGVRGKNCRNN